MEIVSVCASLLPIEKYIIEPLTRRVSYAFTYTTKVAELRHNVETLAGERDNLWNSVEDARRRGDEIQKNVEKWLADAQKAIEGAEELVEGEKEAKKRCFAGLCPNLKVRYQLGKKAVKESSAIDSLKNEGRFDRGQISYRAPPPQIVTSTVNCLEGLPSRESILKEVMDALKDPEVNMIGLYGLGGTGKTTLASEVQRQALEAKLFDLVVMVTVSENPQFEKIQGIIADVMGLKLEEETVEVRASRLHQKLKEKEKILVILDNLWATIKLTAIGIPWGDEHKGCKMLLTSRNLDVLTSGMRIQKFFKLEPLSEAEAWKLFQITVGDSNTQKMPPFANEVASKCVGIPLAIVTVANALRNKGQHAWKNALKQLSMTSRLDNRGMQAEVYGALEFSFDHLDGEEVKSLFSLLPLYLYSYIGIDYLLKDCVGLRLFEGIDSIEDARNRLLKLIDDLKAACFLQDSDWNSLVKMHDFVQAFAMSIASRAQNAAVVKTDFELKEFAERHIPNSCTRLSLLLSDPCDLPEDLKCPELEFLLVSGNHSLRIPDSFFSATRKLKVLDCYKVSFSCLPQSLGLPTSLHTLCLERCVLPNIAMFGTLKKLEILTLIGSDIVELPREIGQLTQLKALVLSDCTKLEVIPANVLSQLSLLEELYMGNSFVYWEIKGFDNQSNASLSELEHLSRLTNLEIDVPDARKLPKGLFFERLERSKISIGDGWDWGGEYLTSRTLKLKLHTSIHGWNLGVKTLLKKAEDLYLDEVKGVTNVLYDLHKEGFPQLKHLLVQKGGEIRYIIDAERRLPFDAFPVLESLILHSLVNLEKICRGQLMAGDFCQLRILRVRSCNKLKNLFSFSMLRNLKQLREMEVKDCSGIEEIFSGETEEEDDENGAFKFTQLCSLELQLPLLRRFCSKVKSSPASTFSSHSRQNQPTNDPRWPLFNEMIVFPNLKKLKLSSIIAENIWCNQFGDHASFYNLTSLTVEACMKITYLFTSATVRSLGQLQRLEICKCTLMEGVISAEGEMISETSFPKLEFLKLKGLSKLVRFFNGDFMELPCLKELWIENCPALKSFVSNSIATASGANLALFDEKVAFPNLEGLSIEEMNGLKMIWHNELHEGSFCKLKALIVRQAEELVNVFPSNMLMRRFLNLERLDLTDCELLEKVFDLPPHEELINFRKMHGMPASQLKTLQIGRLPNLKCIWTKDAQEREIIFFHNLHKVFVGVCPSLKSIFPYSIATSLLKLKELNIIDSRIEVIVDRGDVTEAILDFPQLTSLGLCKLWELKTLYPGAHTSYWPKLENLEVLDCPEVEIFSLESGSIGENGWRSQSENPSRQSFFIVEKVIPNLEVLTLNNKDAKLILNGLCPELLFDKVRFLHLEGFDEESASFLFALLGRFRNLENLEVVNNSLQELFSCEGLINEENRGRTIPRIRHMKLHILHKLKRVCKQNCQLDHIFESLETLEVWRCNSLISLGPSINIASFGNLSHLDVWRCESLLNLVTVLMAPCLGLLTKLSIRECSSVKEVVVREGNHREGQITWVNLKSLELHSLASLTCFCSAHHTFNFPSLEEVIVTRCPLMKTFSGGVSITPKLKRVKMAEGENDRGCWEGDLNITIQQLCAELVGHDGIEHLELSEHPQLIEKWQNERFPANFFSNLSSLIVDECASLSTAIPSNLSPFLENLLELEVKNCGSIEEVFDLTLSNVADGQIGTLPKLNKLRLIDLPRLKHVWNEEPKGFFDFRNLEVFKIHNCGSLRYIFTPTTCLGLVRLRELEVKDCPLIENIISKEATAYNVVFPLLSSVALERLPNLISFYNGSGTVQCPSLQKIAVVECSSTLTSTFLNEPAPNATNRASRAKLVFPNLKQLELSSIKVEEMWNNQLVDESSIFKHLTILIVENCENLRYLFTYSMVEYIDQIERLDICNCKSVEEVVLRRDVGDGENRCKMLFPKLEILKLKSLPKLTTFCTCSLFECPVLKKLEIDNCPRLKSLVSDSTSADLAPGGQIDKCDSALFDEKVAFPDLEELTIRNMYWLKMIWHNELHEDSFGKLRILRVEQAEALRKVFPSGMLVRRFQNLEQLFIENCESLDEVFDIQGLMTSVEEAQVATAAWTRLKNLEIQNLPNLKRVWNQDPREILSFHNLNDVFIWKCPNLRSLFPASVARGLLELESLTINDCGIEEIVEKEEGEETTAPAFVFPKLNALMLWMLPELKRFYPGMHTSEWPALKFLTVYHCDKVHILESHTFRGEEELDGIQDERFLFPFQEVIPNLVGLALTCDEAKMMMESQFPEKLFHNLKSLKLQCFHDKSAALPSGLFERFPNIGKLTLQCNQRTELFPDGLIGEGARIHKLGLQIVPDARHTRRQESQVDALLQNLDSLELWTSNGLTNLAPFSASFQSITLLVLFECRALVHLFTLSTAETLGQLTTMIIRDCDLVTEIVASTGHDTDHEIVFYKLATLDLHRLPSLTSFCSGEHNFKFPSLSKVNVSQCPKMEIFSRGVLRTPKLHCVTLTRQGDKECWNGNLNATIQHLYKKMVGFHGLQDLRLINFPNLSDAWHSEMPVECFYNLRSLVVENCASFSNAVPSSLLSFLIRLKELDVRNCDSVEEVFGLEGLSANLKHPVLSKLNSFLLSDLPRLRHPWNKASCGILDFGNLKLLKVHNCSSLKYIFTPTMALSLVQIQELEVKNCHFVGEIITGREEEAIVDTIFSQLSSLVLESLPNLTSFCSTTDVLELQSLDKVTVIDCPRIETFASTMLGAQKSNIVDGNEERRGHEGFSTPNVLLFGSKVTCRNLKELKVEWSKNMKDLLRGKFPTECFAKIKVLELTNFPHDETFFPSDIFLRLPYLEKLVVNDAHFEELFLEQRMVDMESNSEDVTKLRQLKLSRLPKLSQLFQDHSISDLVIQNLETLEVLECIGLNILMPSSLSFENLTTLEVSKCHGLTNLMSSSTAKSLGKLTRISITECDMMEEIVASEGNEGEDEIAFSQLEHLGLHCLPNLVGFCSGNHTFNFPCLEEVTLRECSKMKFFSEGALFTPQLTEVQMAVDGDQRRWEGSLNTTVQQLFSEMCVGNAQGH